jgi:hypothetical protein
MRSESGSKQEDTVIKEVTHPVAKKSSNNLIVGN